MSRDAVSEWSLPQRALGAGLAASLALLAGAHIFEAAGYAPCELCLDQREAHWAAAAVAAAGVISGVVLRAPLAAAASVGALALIYAISAGLALYHTGVENGYWPGPATCSTIGGAINDLGALSAVLEPGGAAGARGPTCGAAAWRLFGVSMAGYNLLASAGLFVLSLMAAVETSRRVREERRPVEALGAAE
ncbi:MAG: disulfide bond formation protein B [Pseudomonadota bacterium]